MILDIVLFIAGLLILAYSNWYVAKQRNAAGVEEYSGFFSMLMHRGIAVGMGLVGAVLAIAGALMFVFGFLH